jgi:predicted acyl esterase
VKSDQPDLKKPAAEPGEPLDLYTEMVAVRDGEELAVDVFLPAEQGSFPTVFIFTPYNRKLLTAAIPVAGLQTELFDRNDFAFVVGDWRGFHGSKQAKVTGPKDPHKQVGEDGHDLVEWIAAQPWSNGRIGMWGPSALGVSQYRTAIEKPPHLTCIAPSVRSFWDAYHQYYYNGVFKLSRTQTQTKGGFTDTMAAVTSIPLYNKLWEDAYERTSVGLVKLDLPVFFVGGWYDTETEGQIKTVGQVLERAGPRAREHSKLLIGPWEHITASTGKFIDGKLGEVAFPEADFVSDRETRRFFDYWLRDRRDNGWASEPRIRYFVMGRNRWASCSKWPPEGIEQHELFLRANGGLAVGQEQGEAEPHRFRYDPRDPSPTIGGNNLYFQGNDPDVIPAMSGPMDQRERVESRTDLVSFTSDRLDDPVTVLGRGEARLFVSSDQVDTDFVVRLCDVYPDGRSMLVTDGVQRARFRDSLTEPELLTPEEVYLVTIVLPETAHTFLEGHRIRILVTSSNYPRFARNPNNGEYFVKPDEMDKVNVALNSIYHDASHPSRLLLPVARQ